ncbi:MAG: hypothetical protein GWN53_06805, partial [Gammaproteobacteria bacterium]|nr:hypothetical protein [Gammaproteobacteria bacterium]
MTLGLVGLGQSEVDVDFGNHVMTVERTALRVQKRLARTAAIKPRKRVWQQSASNPLPYSKMIDRIARENGVSPALAAAVIKVES